jgi:aspartate-semialdehyde dehydrogenase
MKKYNIAILGATGAVGQEFLKLIEERKVPFNELKLLASERSAGKKIVFMGKTYTVEQAKPESFENIQIALFAGGAASKTFAPEAVKRGAVVIDNSSAFRMDPNVPLVVPEVNPEDISWHKGIIANPNCSTIQAVVALKPIDINFGIKRIIYSTYQAVSGAGLGGYKDLEDGIKGEAPKKFQYPIANNLIPQIDVFMENGYTKEEMKMIEETKKIMHNESLKITATTVRVPVYYGHSESINLELSREYSLEEVTGILKASPGIILMDDIKNNIYPMPVNAAGRDEVFVGRVRRDFSIENGLNLWVVADNIRKGAASNAVQIAELL